MRLVHFSAEPLGALRTVVAKMEPSFKPHGLWLSDEDDEQSWSAWCTAEEFGLGTITTEFDLVPNHNVLHLASADDLLDFTADYGSGSNVHKFDYIDWQRVADKYQGLLITPYVWSCRYDLMWYYGWDCASACVWDVSALARSVRW